MGVDLFSLRFILGLAVLIAGGWTLFQRTRILRKGINAAAVVVRHEKRYYELHRGGDYLYHDVVHIKGPDGETIEYEYDTGYSVERNNIGAVKEVTYIPSSDGVELTDANVWTHSVFPIAVVVIGLLMIWYDVTTRL